MQRIVLQCNRAPALTSGLVAKLVAQPNILQQSHTIQYWAWRYFLKQLCISAASGDRLLKRYVVAMPDLQEQQLSSQDDALILASDGLWDVLTNQDAAQCIKDIKVILLKPLQALRL